MRDNVAWTQRLLALSPGLFDQYKLWAFHKSFENWEGPGWRRLAMAVAHTADSAGSISMMCDRELDGFRMWYRRVFLPSWGIGWKRRSENKRLALRREMARKAVA